MGDELVEAVVSHDIVGRLMIMSVRQPGLLSPVYHSPRHFDVRLSMPGLSRVYDQTLGFDGDEFYSDEWPVVGVPFGQAADTTAYCSCRF